MARGRGGIHEQQVARQRVMPPPERWTLPGIVVLVVKPAVAVEVLEDDQVLLAVDGDLALPVGRRLKRRRDEAEVVRLRAAVGIHAQGERVLHRLTVHGDGQIDAGELVLDEVVGAAQHGQAPEGTESVDRLVVRQVAVAVEVEVQPVIALGLFVLGCRARRRTCLCRA